MKQFFIYIGRSFLRWTFKFAMFSVFEQILFSTDHNAWIEKFLAKFTNDLGPIYIGIFCRDCATKLNLCNGTAYSKKCKQLFEYVHFLLLKDI
jgi:hypothetical protein